MAIDMRTDIGSIRNSSNVCTSGENEAQNYLKSSQTGTQSIGQDDEVVHNRNSIDHPKSTAQSIQHHGGNVQGGGVAILQDCLDGRQWSSVEKDQDDI
eukprot:scaffold14573_cov59-Cylindrotheca_fusiformis.AAC.1